jgi:hypothetical protein
MPASNEQINQSQEEIRTSAEKKEGSQLLKHKAIYEQQVDAVQQLADFIEGKAPLAKSYVDGSRDSIYGDLLQLAQKGQDYIAEREKTDRPTDTEREKAQGYEGGSDTGASGAGAGTVPAPEGQPAAPELTAPDAADHAISGEGIAMEAGIDAIASQMEGNLAWYQQQLDAINFMDDKVSMCMDGVDAVRDLVPFQPPEMPEVREQIQDALRGEFGICNILKFLNSDPSLPQEYIDSVMETFGTRYGAGSGMDALIAELNQGLVVRDQYELVQEKYSAYIDYDTLTGDPVPWTYAGASLPPEEQAKILAEIKGVAAIHSMDIYLDTCPPYLESFWMGQKLMMQGDVNGATESLNRFLTSDLEQMKADPRFANRAADFEQQAKDMLGDKELLDQKELHKEFYDADNALRGGDYIKAKQLLKKYLARKDLPKENFRDTAEKMMKQIALTQLNKVKEQFSAMPYPGPKNQPPGSRALSKDERDWNAIFEQLQSLEQKITRGEFSDFDKAAASLTGQMAQTKFNVIEDESMLGEGRPGLLKLAKKYKALGDYEKARMYYREYFGTTLADRKENIPNANQIKANYLASPVFRTEIDQRMEATKTSYEAGHLDNVLGEVLKKKGGARPAWAQIEAEVRQTLEKQALDSAMTDYSTKMVQDGLLATRRPDYALMDESDLPEWNEWMVMEGFQNRDNPLLDTFTPSAETIRRIIQTVAIELPVMIALGAISGGAAAFAGAAMEAVTTSRMLILGAKFMTEVTVFTVGGMLFESVKAGNLDQFTLENFGMGMATNALFMGVLKTTGAFCEAAQMSELESLAMRTGAFIGTNKMLGQEFTIDSALMLAGMETSGFMQKWAAKRAQRAKAEKSAKQEGKGRFEAEIPGKVKTVPKTEAPPKAGPKVEAKAKAAAEPSPKPAQKPSAEAPGEPRKPTAAKGALDTHFESVFGETVPEEVRQAARERGESGKKIDGWISKKGKIHYGSEHFKEMFGVEMVRRNGKNRFVVDGVEMSPEKFGKTPKFKAVLAEMQRVKAHEVMHRLGTFAENASKGELGNKLQKLLAERLGTEKPDKAAMEELLAKIADGQVKLEPAEAAALEAAIGEYVPDFKFSQVRRVDVKVVATNPAEAFARERSAARSTDTGTPEAPGMKKDPLLSDMPHRKAYEDYMLLKRTRPDLAGNPAEMRKLLGNNYDMAVRYELAGKKQIKTESALAKLTLSRTIMMRMLDRVRATLPPKERMALEKARDTYFAALERGEYRSIEGFKQLQQLSKHPEIFTMIENFQKARVHLKILDRIGEIDFSQKENAKLYETLLQNSEKLTAAKMDAIDRFATDETDIMTIINHENPRLLEMLARDKNGILDDYTDLLINSPETMEQLFQPDTINFIEKNVDNPNFTQNLLERILMGSPDKMTSGGKEIEFYPANGGAPLGKGGIGSVYRVVMVDPVSGKLRFVAAKVINPDVALRGHDLGSEVQGSRRIQSVIDAELKAGNPDAKDLFVEPVAVGDDGQMIFYEIVDYRTEDGTRTTRDLEKMMADPASDPEILLKGVYDNARALEILHRNRMVHGDEKGSQSMRTDTGSRLGDFGTIQTFEELAGTLTRPLGAYEVPDTGDYMYLSDGPQVSFTPPYSSGAVHDVIRGNPDAAWKVDAYALGCTIEEMLTGKILLPAATPDGRYDPTRYVESGNFPEHLMPDPAANAKLWEIAWKLKDHTNLTYTVADAVREMAPYIKP